jgi:hypothetical protein
LRRNRRGTARFEASLSVFHKTNWGFWGPRVRSTAGLEPAPRDYKTNARPDYGPA